MNNQEFSDVMEVMFEEARATVAKKGTEYARGDRLSNFKKAAALMGCTPERALFGFLAKHLVSLSDMVNDLEAGQEAPRQAWNEKIGDAHVYLILLKAMRHANG